MSINQGFTEKAQQALGLAQQRTKELRIAQLEPVTVLQALLNQSAYPGGCCRSGSRGVAEVAAQR